MSAWSRLSAGSRSRRGSGLVARTVLVAFLLAGCNGGSSPSGGASSPPASGTPTGQDATTTGRGASASSTPVSTPPPKQEKASAAKAMAAFVAAARTQDTMLREAARLINGGISARTVSVTSQTAKAVKAVDLQSVAKTIPAGLSDDLLTGTMLVYSELVSRSDAMSHFRFPATYDRQHVDPLAIPNADQMLACLSHGAPAAHAFATDLQALEQLARTRPPVDVAAPTSRAAAEVAVYLALVNKANGCSDECGGTLLPRLPAVRWDADPSGKNKASGALGETVRGPGFDLSHINFEATYQRSQGWIVNIRAC